MILVLRALGIGDLITCVPALRGLRAAFPGQALTLAAPAWLAPLASLVPAVDRLVPVAGLGQGEIPVRPPYWAVNLHGRGPQSHRLLQATDPATLCAFACPEAGHLDGPPWIAEEPEVERWCRLLAWHGIRADPGDRSLLRPRTDAVPAGAVLIHPGAKGRTRRWPPGRFAEVAETLHRHGHRVLVTGSPAEVPLATDLARRAGLPAAAVLAGRLDVGELAAAVARARLVISGDTGVAHLATAYHTRSVVLFGPMPPHRWGPPPQRTEHRVLWHGELAGGADHHGPDPALLAITVEEVLAAASEMLRSGHASTRGPV